MALVTLRVLDGADRGRVFQDVPTPLTVGREEGNAVQLNDERVSRYHLKIQEDQQEVVLTDLQSTNGTKVNGEAVQLCVLRPGDIVSVGRTVLLYGSRLEIARRLAQLRGADLSGAVPLEVDELEEAAARLLEAELGTGDAGGASPLHYLMPPELPAALSPGQAAQLAELLQYLHLRLRGLIHSIQIKPKAVQVVLELRHWQTIVDLQDRLAAYLRQIGEPME